MNWGGHWDELVHTGIGFWSTGPYWEGVMGNWAILGHTGIGFWAILGVLGHTGIGLWGTGPYWAILGLGPGPYWVYWDGLGLAYGALG